MLNARDVTDRVEAARVLANRAFSDPLTGLPNRVRLLDRLASALADPTWAPVAAMVCDIDQFKPLNAVAGREAGDDLLRDGGRSAPRRPLGDRYPVARLGGDAFAVILAGVPIARGAHAGRQRPRGPWPNRSSSTAARSSSASAPASPWRARATDPRRSCTTPSWRWAGPSRTAAIAPRCSRRRWPSTPPVARTCRTSCATPSQHDGVRVHFQPIVDIATEQAVGAEALLRVHDDEGVLLSPAEFVEAAESSGLISRLGLQVLQITCEQLATWSATGEAESLGELSVNVSPRQLADPDLPAPGRARARRPPASSPPASASRSPRAS